MNGMLMFLGIASVMLWVCGIFGAFVIAVKALIDKRPRAAWVWGAITLLLVALTLTVIMSAGTDDSHPGRLCLRGHQEWIAVTNGKVTSMEKRWTCDEWEASR